MMQWQANVSHLEGQLSLSQAIIQAKDETINALKLSNYMHQHKSIVIPEKACKQSEDIVPGIIAVTEYEGKGFTVNFAEIVKRLKRRFGN